MLNRYTDFAKLGQTEIQNLLPIVLRDEKIFGFEVAMNHSLAMSGRQPLRDLERIVRGFARGQEDLLGQCQPQGAERAGSRPFDPRTGSQRLGDHLNRDHCHD